MKVSLGLEMFCVRVRVCVCGGTGEGGEGGIEIRYKNYNHYGP